MSIGNFWNNSVRKYKKMSSDGGIPLWLWYKIKEFFKECPGKISYCWGGNWKDRITLPNDYGFVQTSESEGEDIKVLKPYELCGFDCCGLLYYVSDGLLRRSARGIRKPGKILWRITKQDVITREELASKLEKLELQDTDCIVIRTHLATWWQGGILDFRGVDYGCAFVNTKDEIVDKIMRFISTVHASEDEDNDVRFIRWHPELLKEEFEKYFPKKEVFPSE